MPRSARYVVHAKLRNPAAIDVSLQCRSAVPAVSDYNPSIPEKLLGARATPATIGRSAERPGGRMVVFSYSQA